MIFKTKKEEFEKEGFANYEKYTSDLKNMKSKEAIIATMDVYVLMNLTRILDELIELIESGKFSSMSNEDLEFYKATQEALDRCDDSKEGMSVDEFLKELDSW